MKVTTKAPLPSITLVIELTAEEATGWRVTRDESIARTKLFEEQRRRRSLLPPPAMDTPVSRLNDAIHAELKKRGY